MTTYYKATRLDGTSFYDGETTWQVGRITRHPNPDLSLGLCSKGVLHASDAPGETLLGGSWPCRLFRVEPRGALVDDGSHKVGCAAWKVQEELPAWWALGPNGEAVAAFIERCKTITADERRRVNTYYDARVPALVVAVVAAHDAARGVAGGAARVAARDAAGAAARVAAGDAARVAALAAAAWALVVRDLISPADFTTLVGPWESVMGRIA